MARFIELFDTECDYSLQFTVKCVRAHTHTCLQSCLHYCYLVSAFSSGCSPSSRFLNCPQQFSDWLQLKLKLIYDRQSVNQSVLVSGSHLDPMSRFLCFLCDDCGFLDVGRPLWQEDGYVIYLYNCFWALQEQLLFSRSPTELMTIFYCLIWDYPNMEGQVPVFIFPWNRVAQLYPRALGTNFCRAELRYVTALLTGPRYNTSAWTA
jgi:hypothetical protein